MRFSAPLSLGTLLLTVVFSGCSSDNAVTDPVARPESFWRLDGNSSFIQVASTDAPVLGAGDFTVEAWFKPDTLGSRWDLFDWKDTVGAQGSLRNDLAIYYNGSSILAYAAIDDYTKSEIGIKLTGAGAWHHVALVRSGSTLAVMLDTAAQTATYPGAVNPKGPFRIGSNRPSDGGAASGVQFPFKGIASDVRVYSRALTLAEFRADTRVSASTGGNLVRRWKLSEADGVVATEDVAGKNGMGKGIVAHTTTL